MSIIKRRGQKKAVVAVARKLATMEHTMLRGGSEFRLSTATAVQPYGEVAA